MIKVSKVKVLFLIKLRRIFLSDFSQISFFFIVSFFLFWPFNNYLNEKYNVSLVYLQVGDRVTINPKEQNLPVY